jgi:hypothetical protein
MSKEILSFALVGLAGLAAFVLLKPMLAAQTATQFQPSVSDAQAKWQGLSSIVGSLSGAAALAAYEAAHSGGSGGGYGSDVIYYGDENPAASQQYSDDANATY